MTLILILLIASLIGLSFLTAVLFHVIHWLLADRRSDKNLIKAYEQSRAQLLAQNYALAAEVQQARDSIKPYPRVAQIH
jgi:cell division protein FtsB